MKHIILVLALILSLFRQGYTQTLPTLVEKGFDKEMSGDVSRYSNVDFKNINQKKINKLIAKKSRKIQMLHNPLLLISGSTQRIDISSVKAAKHHTLYISKTPALTHTENTKEFKTYVDRYDYYSNGDFGSIYEILSTKTMTAATGINCQPIVGLAANQPFTFVSNEGLI